MKTYNFDRLEHLKIIREVLNVIMIVKGNNDDVNTIRRAHFKIQCLL